MDVVGERVQIVKQAIEVLRGEDGKRAFEEVNSMFLELGIMKQEDRIWQYERMEAVLEMDFSTFKGSEQLFSSYCYAQRVLEAQS